jgi:hypothetical protein
MNSLVRQCAACGVVLSLPSDRAGEREAMLRELATMVTRYRAHNDQVASKLSADRTVRR